LHFRGVLLEGFKSVTGNFNLLAKVVVSFNFFFIGYNRREMYLEGIKIFAERI
jgi:hypothetical protein